MAKWNFVTRLVEVLRNYGIDTWVRIGEDTIEMRFTFMDLRLERVFSVVEIETIPDPVTMHGRRILKEFKIDV